MLQLYNSEKSVEGPGAFVRLQTSAAPGTDDVYCLVMPHDVLPFCSLSSLKRLTVYTPNGHSNVIHREWVRFVSVDWQRGATIVHLTCKGAHWLLEAGATCRAVASAKKETSATYVRCVNKEGKLQLEVQFATVQQVGATIEINSKWTGQGLIFGEHGNVLAVSRWGTHYSLLEMTNEFLADRIWRIRCYFFGTSSNFICFNYICRILNNKNMQ